jgi:hypothetical protein
MWLQALLQLQLQLCEAPHRDLCGSKHGKTGGGSYGMCLLYRLSTG